MSTKITNEQLAARQTKTKRKEEAGAADHLRAEAAEERAEKAEAENRQRGGPPGEWVCDKCAFALHSRIINAQTGDIGVPRVQEIPDCLNGCGPLRPETWKGLCDSYGETIDRLNESCKQERERAEKAEEKITQFIHGEDRPDAYVTQEEATSLRRELADYKAGQKVGGRVEGIVAAHEAYREVKAELEECRQEQAGREHNARSMYAMLNKGFEENRARLVEVEAERDEARARHIHAERKRNEATEELDAALERERGLRDALEAMCTCDAKSGYSCPYHRFVGS